MPDLAGRWLDSAACLDADPEAWHPAKGESPRMAVTICRRCEVRVQCLQFALDSIEQTGVYGGFTLRERRRVARSGLSAAAAIADDEAAFYDRIEADQQPRPVADPARKTRRLAAERARITPQPRKAQAA